MSQKPPPNFTGLWVVHDEWGGRSETEYVDGVRNGFWREWHPSGVCTREGFYKNDLYHGPLITRGASSGEIRDVSEFTDGTGLYRIFNSAGGLTDEIPLVAGKAHGTARRWVAGRLLGTWHYEQGKCVAVVAAELTG